MTDQEIFDKVATHLLTQNAKSLLLEPGQPISCLYRGREGKKCAIGCLIPDELYTPYIEGKRIFTLPMEIRKVLEEGATSTSSRIELLGELQDVHDAWNVVEWP